MLWNWQHSNWPKFHYQPEVILKLEKNFLLEVGSLQATLQHLPEKDINQFVVEILSHEGIESSKIEGELLDRESLQSSIKRHFGLKERTKTPGNKEVGMANLLCNLYETYSKPLTHQMLWEWYSFLFQDSKKGYRTHKEPMQIVSNRLDLIKVFFEVPPSEQVPDQMNLFIDWFNNSMNSSSILGRAAIAHLYFESIHPFEDGNGRIGRALIEKVLCQGVGSPLLIAVSKVLEKNKKEYYEALGKCNKCLKADGWVSFLSEKIVLAQKESKDLLHFLIYKTKTLTSLQGLINERQEKVLLKLFECGLSGFIGGLNAEKYIAITKTSRASATRDLTELVEKGVLLKTGELRHTRYRLNYPGK